jgi:hypothetical protein
MKNLALLVVLSTLLGCANMTEKEKNITAIVVGVVVAGVILSSGSSSNSYAAPSANCPITWPPDPDGVTVVCPR